MSDSHIEEHSTWIKTPKQLVIVVLLSFIVTVFVIVVLVKLIVEQRDFGPSNPAMSAEAIAKRLKPVGEAVVDPEAAKLAQAAAAAAPATAPVPAMAAAPAAAGSGKGKSIYDSACLACHAAGVAGAPKTGDKAAWAPRLAAGVDALYASAIKGKNAMPPKGGQMQLADADVKAAVDYMVDLVK